MPRKYTIVAAIALVARAALATEPPVPPPAPDQASPAPSPAPTPQPSLDELLGLPKAGEAPKPPPAKPEEQPKDLDKDALERKLSDEEAAEAFAQAVREMGLTAERLEKAKDTGLTTQRLQEAILRKLDQVIKNSQEQQSSSSSSSSSSQDPSGAKKPAPPRPQQGKQNQAGKGENNAEATPPAMQQADLKGNIDAVRAAWGALPERLREIFTQGMDEYYSKLYESMTQSYYKKTAQNAGQP